MRWFPNEHAMLAWGGVPRDVERTDDNPDEVLVIIVRCVDGYIKRTATRTEREQYLFRGEPTLTVDGEECYLAVWKQNRPDTLAFTHYWLEPADPTTVEVICHAVTRIAALAMATR